MLLPLAHTSGPYPACRAIWCDGCLTCQRASGLISDGNNLVKAVRSETRRHDYDEVILATGRQRGSWLARELRLDPVHQLRFSSLRLDDGRGGARLLSASAGPTLGR